MEIGKIAAVAQPAPPPLRGADSEGAIPVQRSQVTREPVKVAATEEVDLQPNDERRMEAIRRAVEQHKDLFVVRDSTFSIFKDAGGQIITRFTSLRDGSVTYFPEPELVKHLQYAGVDVGSIAVNA